MDRVRVPADPFEAVIVVVGVVLAGFLLLVLWDAWQYYRVPRAPRPRRPRRRPR